MADVVEFNVIGISDLSKALNDLAADLRRKVVIGALRDAARPMVLAGRAEAPVLQTYHARRVAGTLRRNIKAFVSKKYKGQNGVIGVYISVKASKKDLKRAPITGDPYYWRWVAGGHRIVPRSRRTGSKGGKNTYALTIRARRSAATAEVKPNPFLDRAFKSSNNAALRIFEQRIAERIAKANAAK